MLERVMRRFGVSGPPSAREQTYFETLLERARPRVTERVANGEVPVPLLTLARELVRLESEANNEPTPDLESPESEEGLIDYLSLLRDNDHLPQTGQLTPRELHLARPLLLRHDEDPQRAGKTYDRVLGLLEDKFSSGYFTQAALLLRLFETTPARQRSNERTLFYEEMLARFASPRPGRLPAQQVKRYTKAVNAADQAHERLVSSARWLSQNARVRLDVLTRPKAEVEAWKAALGAKTAPALVDSTLALIPHPRWRAIEEVDDVPLVAAVQRHIELGGLVEYLDRLLKACYFVVVVTSRTGFETIIKHYLDWVTRNFDFPGSRLLPQLHKMTTLEEQGLHEALATIRRQFFEPLVPRLRQRIEDGAVTRAIADLGEMLRTVDPNDLPPGDYDLVGLLLDRITGLHGDAPTVLFRVHRLC